MRAFVSRALVAFVVAVFALSCASAQENEPKAGADEHAAAEGGHEAGGHHELGHGNDNGKLEAIDEVKGDLGVYTFAVFMLLLAILSKAAWPSISAALVEREKRIEGAIADAAAKQEEAKRLLAEHEAKLASAAAEVKAVLDEARRDAEARKAEIVAEAQAAAKAEHDRAKRDIEVAIDGATKHLAETSANLAVELAGKAIRETINPAKSQELVREALAKLSATAPSRN